ncbi:MAG: FAD-dependent oxidoreductase [Treponema sp.]|nr:FAD-dependent oxidoreductase [Treponema sp.]
MRKLAKKGNMNSRMNIVLNKFKSSISSYPPGMCPLVLYRSLLQMSMNQSCGKCVPCRDGLVEVERLLNSVLKGEGSHETLEKMKSMCVMISESADCAVGVVAANMILDSLCEFSDEYESHITERRCVENTIQTIPCVTLCPAHVNVPGYIALIKEKRFADAINLIRDKNPFPTACAMICEHPCENKCRRSIIDEPINIRGLKKFAVDECNAREVKTPKANVKTGKKIAIVGGGPSGLTCAYFLSLMGHKAVVFEEHEKLGGMLRYGIPEYRLPKDKLDDDIEAILKSGDIEVKFGVKVGRDIQVQELRKDFDAVYLGIGAQLGNRMPMENSDCPNVIPAADFLQKVAKGEKIDIEGKRVVLIGGGNVAMDAARTAARLKASTIHVFTRKRDDMTALRSEVHSAMQEGVRFRTLLNFLHIEANKDTGLVQAVWLQPEILGPYDKNGMMTTEHSSAYPYRFKCDLLILGVGQRSDVESFEKAGLSVEKGRILADETCQVQGAEGVFSGGDCVTGPSTAINAIAAGQVAAFNIDEYLGYHHKVECNVKIPNALLNNYVPTGRAMIEERDPFERVCDFKHVEIPMTEEEGAREAGRCLRCDYFGCGSMVGGKGDDFLYD